MRLIDLISFIRTSSQMYYRQTLTDYQRIELIKLAFPRPDLIKWFDECASSAVPPERYMLLLLMTAAAALVPSHMTRVHYGSEADLDLFRSLSSRHGPQDKEIIIGPSMTSAMGRELTAVGSDRIGLIQGVMEDEADLGSAGVVSPLTFSAPHARRICITSNSTYAAYLMLNATWKGIIAWQGHLVYQGVLQYWPARTSAVIFRSYIDPLENER